LFLDILPEALMLWFVLTGTMIIVYARREMLAVWREPMLRRPVLIIESDDWGAGPARQTEALREIVRVLHAYSDYAGRHPVMTLGIILANADGAAIEMDGNYHREMISAPAYGPLLDVIREGVESGAFALQLHGMEHFWPPALMAASEQNVSVKSWLALGPEASTEELPSHLQSRWVDASVLPAKSLTRWEVKKAAREEVNAFQAIFRALPRVVVPPTFVWNDSVEQAWAEIGVEVVITPGRRFETRDEKGRPSGARRAILNGQVGEAGCHYLVRDIYFEPALGHGAGQALDALRERARLGRPALYETHRFNFLGPTEQKRRALAELERLLTGAVNDFPELAFLSSEKLAEILTKRDQEWQEWLEQRCRRRVHVWLKRLGEFTRLRKLAWITGWVAPAWLVWKLTA
jgi:hypothetical protein